MSLLGCVVGRASESLLLQIEQAIRENSPAHLLTLLSGVCITDIDRRCLLHQATWLGYPQCVRVILAHGADPNIPHRSNGCTPLHLAHFRTVEESDPGTTISVLMSAGADVNSPGICGRTPLEHAVHHQRLDSVQRLIESKAHIGIAPLLIAIDVANPAILELLLHSGAPVGSPCVGMWGKPLQRVLATPLKCPRECYRSMFRLVTQATVFHPARLKDRVHSNVEEALNQLAPLYPDLSIYLATVLLRCGYCPSLSVKNSLRVMLPWVDQYLTRPPHLTELCVRALRGYLVQSGNILHSVDSLILPSHFKRLLTMSMA